MRFDGHPASWADKPFMQSAFQTSQTKRDSRNLLLEDSLQKHAGALSPRRSGLQPSVG